MLNARILPTFAALAAALAMAPAGIAGNGEGNGNGPPDDSPAERRAASQTEPEAETASTSGGSRAPSDASPDQQDRRTDRRSPRAEETKKGSEAPAEPPAEEEPVEPTGGTPAPAPASEPAPVVVAAPAGGTPAPTSTGAADGSVRRRSGARGPADRQERTGATPTATVPSFTPAAGAVEPRRRNQAPARRPAARTERDKPRSIPSKIGATVTRLVEVTPDWVLALLGGLGVLTLALACVSGVATWRATKLDRQRRRLADDVGLLQSALLPVLPPEVGSAFVSAAYRPADGPGAGGDFYDAFPLSGGRTAVIVGDVEGHGRSALPLTAMVRYTVRAHLESGLEPRLALQAADAALFNQLHGRLVTVVAAVYEPLTGHLTYACAGHPQPVLIGDEVPPVESAASPPIGSGTSTGRRQTVVCLPPGSAACFFTDGLVEVRKGDQRLGFDGFADHVRALGADADAETIVAPLVPRDGFADDATACVLRPEPDAAAPPSGRVELLEVRGPDLAIARAFLEECGIDESDASSAVRDANHIIARTGAALLEVRRTATAAEVGVRPTDYLAPAFGSRSAGSTARATGTA